MIKITQNIINWLSRRSIMYHVSCYQQHHPKLSFQLMYLQHQKWQLERACLSPTKSKLKRSRLIHKSHMWNYNANNDRFHHRIINNGASNLIHMTWNTILPSNICNFRIYTQSKRHFNRRMSSSVLSSCEHSYVDHLLSRDLIARSTINWSSQEHPIIESSLEQTSTCKITTEQSTSHF